MISVAFTCSPHQVLTRVVARPIKRRPNARAQKRVLVRAIHVRLLWCLRVFDMASVCGYSAVRARSLRLPWLLQPQLGCFSFCARPSRAVALTSVSSCLSVRAKLLWCLRAVCFGVRAQVLGRPRGVTVVSKSNNYKAWCIVFEDIISNLNKFELLIK